jgi:hypothetical protein
VNPFWNSPTYKIVKLMKATGNQTGVIEQWKAQVERWVCDNPTDPAAAALRAWLPLWQDRKYYSARELAPLWPALGLALGITKRLEPQKSVKRLEHELDYAGLPCFLQDGEKYYFTSQVHLAKVIGQEKENDATAT